MRPSSNSCAASLINQLSRSERQWAQPSSCGARQPDCRSLKPLGIHWYLEEQREAAAQWLWRQAAWPVQWPSMPYWLNWPWASSEMWRPSQLWCLTYATESLNGPMQLSDLSKSVYVVWHLAEGGLAMVELSKVLLDCNWVALPFWSRVLEPDAFIHLYQFLLSLLQFRILAKGSKRILQVCLGVIIHRLTSPPRILWIVVWRRYKGFCLWSNSLTMIDEGD